MHNSPVGGNMSVMTPRLRTLIDHASRLAEPDAVLLRRFATARDPQAFAELVRRYGRLVWGQCRHLLHSEADADDAFQATFLTLANAARTLRDSNKLGPWLHGVAYRICQQVKRTAARRTKREKAGAKAEATRPVPDSAWDTAFAAVHDELATLPDTLRVPFVLCVLEGKGTTEAATQLGLKLGTLSARLSRAKQTLLDRLTARGLTAGLAAVGAVVVGAANAPAGVVGKACEFAAGVAVPANILSLSNGVLLMATQTAKRWVMAAVLGCGLAAGGAGVWQANAQTPAVQKEIEDLVRQRDAENAKREYERLTLKKAQDDIRELEDAAKKQADAKARQPEFKYVYPQLVTGFTQKELQDHLAAFERDGWEFIGCVALLGADAKRNDPSEPMLVFRRKTATTAEIERAVRQMRDLLDKQNNLPVVTPKPKPTETPTASDVEMRLRVEIERLTRELADLKAKEKAFRGDVVQFPLAHLGFKPGEAEPAFGFVVSMIRLKFGDAGLKNVEVRAYEKEVTVTGANGNGNSIAQWLFEQVKLLREPKPTK